MPRISSKMKDYIVSDFCKWLVGELYDKDYTQSDVAEWLDITQPAVSVKISKGKFSLKELLIIFEKLGTDEEQIGHLLKGVKHGTKQCTKSK